MKSIQQIADELHEQFGSSVKISVDKCAKTIDMYKPKENLWCQVDFDRINKVMAENRLIMWMRIESKETSIGIGKELVPVFHIHKKED